LSEKGKFLERLNRFTCLIKLRDKREKAYLANSGRLEEILKKGAECILEEGKGKLPYKLLAVKKENVWVSVDSHLVNKFFLELYKKGKFPYLKNTKFIAKEKKMNGERIDFVFQKNKRNIFVEIKSCTLVEKGIAMFPDAPTLRGKRHVDFLVKRKKEGDDALLVFIVQREDAKSFAPNSFTHFDFAKSLYSAMKEGVKVFLIVCKYNVNRLKLEKKFIKELSLIDVLLNEYHLYRYPEVKVRLKKKSKDFLEFHFSGETCYHCSFEENFYDFIYFAEDRGIKLNPEKIKSEVGFLDAKVKLIT